MSLRQALRRGLGPSGKWWCQKQCAAFSALPQEADAPGPATNAEPDFSFTPPGRNHLFVPGPVNIHDRVLRALSVPAQNHRDPFFAPIFKELLHSVKFIFGTQNGTTFIFSGTGTGGWETAISNTLSPGDKVVAYRYGLFSHLWCDMIKRLGLDLQVVDRRWGEGVDEDELEDILRKDTEKKIKAVCIVHNETTTGVTSDIGLCRKAMDKANHPALLMIDGVSSVGALDFRFDQWRVDVAVTGSQKALSMPTGVTIVCFSNKALEAHKTSTLKRVYFDIGDQLDTNPNGGTPYTPSLHLLYALRESLALLREEGFENVIARHHRLAEGCRAAVKGWGLPLVCKDPRWNSDTLTVIHTPENIDSNLVVKNAWARYNLSLGVGLFQINGKAFRIGHLGNMDELMLASAISGAEMAMIDAGIPITPGSGISKAIEYWQKTSKVIRTRECVLQK